MRQTVYPPPKRQWPGLVAAYVLLSIVLALPGVPLYYYVDPAHKPLVIRVCTGVLLAFTLHRLVRSARERLERQPASAFAAAARPREEVISLAAPFERWQNQVRHSLRSRAYFVQILRPRLLALWEHKRRARGASGLTEAAVPSADAVEPGPLALLWHEPPRQRLPRRGISLRTLQALVQVLEDR
jgi:hypothetical protein